MSVFLEKYVLPILVAITVLLLITNPLKLAVLTRIITGTVLVALAVIVSLILHWRTKNKQSSARETSSPSRPSTKSSFTTPTPHDIYERIKKLPIYEQEHAAQSYKGLSVHWPVRFSSMYKEKNDADLYKVVLTHLNDERGLIFCWFKLSEYPRLKLVHERDAGMEITGIIRAADEDGCVFLKDAKLIFTDS